MSHTTRREFGARSAGALGILIASSQQVRGSMANSALSIGLIGCGGRGLHDSGIAAKHEFAKITAICDIYEDRLAEGRKRFSGAKEYKNYKELLANKDIDAVMICTPAFLHPEMFEAAVQAKKHIFMEKPAAVDAKGCRRVIEAAKKADKNKRISVDYQQRYGKDYRKAYEIVKSGELGAVKMIRAAWLGGPPPTRTGHPQSEEKIRNWYFYRETSGDIIVEQDCHNLDVVNWFMGTHPTRASGYGGRAMRTIGDVLDNLSVTYQFDNGVVLSYSAHQFGRQTYQDISETFICEKGYINTSRRGYTVVRNGGNPETVETKYDITQDAVNEFIDGCLNNKIENAAFHAAESTLVAILGREAIYSRREMTWDKL
ncbi:MAG: Gfo/Idh/MocA family oxidoreductase [Bryobacteraceae bacterium]|nr:Gfo/Idh/MocA family oxidoreductase [Bryobacteraceae bacterium]MDW8379583.1 Gfo/Idh/MocA family oxidoreductase [Bryobacterales bacterium]